MDLSVNKEKGARCGMPEGADDGWDNDDRRYSDDGRHNDDRRYSDDGHNDDRWHKQHGNDDKWHKQHNDDEHVIYIISLSCVIYILCYLYLVLSTSYYLLSISCLLLYLQSRHLQTGILDGKRNHCIQIHIKWRDVIESCQLI